MMSKSEYTITKRTFRALDFEKGSIERQELNRNSITSEYMPSHKWNIKGEHISTSTRTKDEAFKQVEDFMR